MKKTLICGCMALSLSLGAQAQGGTTSPYSQFGVGSLADASLGFARGMNGASIGLRQGNVINTLNPAAYSAVDSLTMLFDMGISGQASNFKEGSASKNTRNANIEYAVASFRLVPKVGMAVGILPYSNINYSYSSTHSLGPTVGNLVETFSGSGGLHQMFMGAGWQMTKRLSIGVNAAYFWGNIKREASTSSTASYVNKLTKKYEAKVKNYKLDFGAQLQNPLKNGDNLIVGATVGVGHSLKTDADCKISDVTNSESTDYIIKDAYSLPWSVGVGVAWYHANKLTLDADFAWHGWGSVDFPAYDNDRGNYVMKSGLLKDRYELRVGADYVPDQYNNNLLKRIHYRLGAGVATPYYNINGKNGPKEITVSAGFGIPIQNRINNRSILNVSAQWVHMSTKDMITENGLRVNIGLTFNERWFAKFKID